MILMHIKIKKRNRILHWAVLVVAAGLFLGGAYLLLNVATPLIVPIKKLDIKNIQVSQQQDRLLIPGLGVNELVSPGDAKALEFGVWHRYPERGDPVKGGNFIMAAHRFNIGRTPGETLRRSPFYHLDKLQINDQLFVDWQGSRYSYKVSKIYSVKPDALQIEAPSDTAKMTLYTCTLAGSSDGRFVVEATIVN